MNIIIKSTIHPATVCLYSFLDAGYNIGTEPFDRHYSDLRMLHDAPNQQLLFEDVTAGLGSTSSYVQSENDLVDDDRFLPDDSQSEEEESSDPPAVLNLGLAQEQPFPSKKISGCGST